VYVIILTIIDKYVNLLLCKTLACTLKASAEFFTVLLDVLLMLLIGTGKMSNSVIASHKKEVITGCWLGDGLERGNWEVANRPWGQAGEFTGIIGGIYIWRGSHPK
jgi:hypothetical protein